MSGTEIATELLDIGRTRLRVLENPGYLRELRNRTGLSQAEMAQLLNVDRSAVCRWESGGRVPRSGALRRYIAVVRELEREVVLT